MKKTGLEPVALEHASMRQRLNLLCHKADPYLIFLQNRQIGTLKLLEKLKKDGVGSIFQQIKKLRNFIKQISGKLCLYDIG